MKSKVSGIIFLLLALFLWVYFYVSFKESFLELFPGNDFGIYTLTDREASGFSTSDVTVSDTMVDAVVNVRSGKAFPFAGFGFNLMSKNGRPSGYLDLSQFDSLSVEVATVRMNSIGIRILTDDPVYSRKGIYSSYRPLEHQIPAGRNFAVAKASISDFRTAEWWLSGQGLDEDDGFTYFYRSMLLEIFNGQGTLRGIPDVIQVKSICLWGKNRDFCTGMYAALGLWILLFAYLVYSTVFRRKVDGADLRRQMDEVARLLKTTDKSLAEIALEVGEKNPSRLERLFCKTFGQKPLDYRREND